MGQTVARRGLLHDLLADESGQDAVEYALLAAIVGIASIATWQALTAAVGDAYRAVDADVQSISGCTPDPGGGGGIGGCS